MNFRVTRSVLWWVAAVLSVAVPGSTYAGVPDFEQSCTSFAVSSPGGVYLADSEDGNGGHPGIEDPESLAVFFWPAFESTHGRMHIGMLYQGEHHSYQAGMNDQGLAYSATAVPHVEMNPNPERPLSWNHDHIWDSMLKGAATVAEAVAIAQSFDYTEGLWFQTMVADTAGDVAVIGPGNDGELAITWKPDDQAFMVASTINVATGDSVGGDSQARYDTATTLLSNAASRDQLDPGTVAEVLEAVSRQDRYRLFSFNTYTVYSDFFDLEDRTASVWYLSNFDEVVRIDLDDELARGAHQIMLTDLFSDTTVQDALDKFDRIGRKGLFATLGIIAVVALLLITAVMLAVRWVVRRRRRAPAETEESASLETEAPTPIPS